MAKKKSEIQQEYKKERNRIQRFIKRAEKRGYIFEDNILPKIPNRITKSSVARLKKLKPDTIYRKALFGGEATQGEIVTGLEGRKAERSQRAKKAQQTRKVNRQAEQRFFTTPSTTTKKSPYPPKSNITIPEPDFFESLPDGGEVIYDNTYDEYISRLSRPITQQGLYGYRSLEAFRVSLRERATLQSITQREVEDVGKSEVGYRIRRFLEWKVVLDYVMYGSSSEAINNASQEFANAITDKTLTLKERKDLADEAESQENWEGI